MSAETKVSLSLQGKNTEVEFSLEQYAQAYDEGLSFSQWINQTYPTDEKDPGLAFDQIAAKCGLILTEDRHHGYRSPTVHDLITGKAQMGIVAPDGEQRYTPAGRLFFPALVIDTLEAALRDNHGTYTSTFMSMVAMTRSITTPRYEKVIIDVSRPRDTTKQPIAQLAEPAKILSITASDVTRSIQPQSIGMQISAQAQRAATMDLIQIALQVHSEEERANRIDSDFLAIVNGDTDAGEAGIIGSAITADSLDPVAITTAGTITQKAWVKYLMQLWKRRRISHVVCNIDTYLAIEGRAGRPTKDSEPAVDEQLNTLPQVVLPMIPQRVSVFIMEDMAANTLVGLDASRALQRIVYAAAEYSAIQEFVMTRSTAFRVDTAERIESLGYADAFAPMTLTV